MSYRHYAVICSDSRYFLVLWLFFFKWALESAVQTEKTLFFFLSTAREIKGDVGGLKVKEPSVRRIGLSLWYSSSCGFWSCAISISKQQGKKRPFFFPPSQSCIVLTWPGATARNPAKFTEGNGRSEYNSGSLLPQQQQKSPQTFQSQFGPSGTAFFNSFSKKHPSFLCTRQLKGYWYIIIQSWVRVREGRLRTRTRNFCRRASKGQKHNRLIKMSPTP